MNNNDDFDYNTISRIRSKARAMYIAGTAGIISNEMMRAYENALQARVYQEQFVNNPVSGLNTDFIVFDDAEAIKYVSNRVAAQYFEKPIINMPKPKNWYRKLEGKKYGKKSFR